jgi:cytochrome bd-type quinol oxidase subunit 1
VWDKKRKLIWIIGGLLMGTYVAYSNSITDEGEFVFSFFIFMETIIILIMAGLYYLYSRR